MKIMTWNTIINYFKAITSICNFLFHFKQFLIIAMQENSLGKESKSIFEFSSYFWVQCL